MAKNVLNRRMFVQNMLDPQRDGIVLPDGKILMPEISIYADDEELPIGTGQDGTSSSDYLGFDSSPKIVEGIRPLFNEKSSDYNAKSSDYNRSVFQEKDNTYQGMKPRSSRDSSDYSKKSSDYNRKVDDPEIIKRNIEKTMVPQNVVPQNVAPQNVVPQNVAPPPPVPQNVVTPPTQFFPPEMLPGSQNVAPPPIPQYVAPERNVVSQNVAPERNVVPGVTFPVSNPQGEITSSRIQGGGQFSGGGQDGEQFSGEQFSGGQGGRQDGGSPLPPQSRPSFIGQIAPAGILTALGASLARNVGGSDQDSVKELREIAESLRESTMPLNMPVFRSEGSPREGENTRFLPNFLPNLRERGYFDPNFYLQKLTGSELLDLFSGALDSDTSYSRSRAKNIKRAAALRIKNKYEKMYGADAVNSNEYNDAIRRLEEDDFDISDFVGKKSNESLIPDQQIMGEKVIVRDGKEIIVPVPTFQPKQIFPDAGSIKFDPARGPRQDRIILSDIETDGSEGETDDSENVESSLIGASLEQDGTKELDGTEQPNNMAEILALLKGDTTEKTPKNFKGRVKDRVSLYKSILGMDDNERKTNAYLVLAQASANVAKSAGKNRKVLDILSEGLQTLPLGLAKAQAADRKQDLAIGTAAISAEEAIDTAKIKSFQDLNKKIMETQLKNLGTDGFKARNLAVQIGEIAKQGRNPFTSSSVKSYIPLLEKEGYLAKGGLPGDIIVANDLLGLPVGTFVSVSKQRDVNKEAINSVYAGESFKKYADAYREFEKGEITRSELDAIADENAFGNKVGVNVTTNEKRVLAKKDVIEENYKVIRKIRKIMKDFGDTYGPGNAISRMFSKLTVPFIGDQESFLADAKKIAAEKNAPEFRRFYRKVTDAAGMKLKADILLEAKEFSDLEPGAFSSVEVAIDGMLDRYNEAANNIIEASAEIDPQFNQIARYVKRTAKGSEKDPFSISDLQHPAVRSTIEEVGLFDKIFYYRLPNGTAQELTGQDILNIK